MTLKANLTKLAIASAIIACSLTAPLTAFSATHPVTGEALAKEQTYTYRLLDGLATLDHS